MEEVNLTELIRYYIRKIPIIILTTLLALLSGYLYIEEFQVPLYNGTTTIILVQKNNGEVTNSITQSELIINEKLVSTYSQLIKSRRVLEQVIDSLELNIASDELADKISVTSVSETSIIEISVSDESNNLAVEIANKIADVFKKEIVTIYDLENVSIIDEAVVENKAYNVNIPKQMILYAFVGVIASCIIIFVMYYFDNTIKTKKEIETKLNIPVIGEIPVAIKLVKEEEKRRKKEQKKLQKNISREEKIIKVKQDVVKKEVSSDLKKDKNTNKSISKNKSNKSTNLNKKSTNVNKKNFNKIEKKHKGGGE